MSSTDSTMTLNVTADPFTQSFTLIMGDGTPFKVSIPDLDAFILYSVNICIMYASQLGASLVLLVVMAIMTKPEKRFVPITILNVLALTINFIRNILLCLYFTGPFSETYAYFAQDYSRVPTSAYGTSIAASVLTLVNLICIEGSLWLQMHVMCLTLRKVYRQAILGASLLIASLAIVVRLVLCIKNSKAIMTLADDTSFTWLSSATNITTTISVFWFCAVFVIKLGFALCQRRKLGLRRFGPMQIIFIIGCQTMIIPAIFSILEYTVNLPSMDSNVITLVSIFLPLSALWATSSTTTTNGKAQQQNAPPLQPQLQPRIFRKDFAGSDVKPKPSYGGVSSTTTTTTTSEEEAEGTRTILSLSHSLLPTPSDNNNKDPYQIVDDDDHDMVIDLEAQKERIGREC